MNLFVMVIVLVSMFMNARWNLLARYTRSEGGFYKKMLIITFPGWISAGSTLGDTHGSMTPLAWAFVIGSGISAAFYLFGLAKAPVQQILRSSSR